jgi:hypothetical protein
MADKHLQKLYRDHTLRRKPLLQNGEEQRELLAKQSDIVGLQRLVGNRGVQSLLARGRISQHGMSRGLMRAQGAPSIQRCGCGGACATCKGAQEDEIAASSNTGNEVQRWWDDEEAGGDSDGSWWDSTTEEVSSWFGGEPESNTGGGSGAQDSDSGGSWVEDAAEEVGSWFSDDEAESEPASESGESGSWWDDLWSEEGDEEADDDDWLPDWLPDIDLPSLDEEDEEGDPIDIGDIEVEVEGEDMGQGVCVGGHGSGSTGGVSVAGLTTIDWSASTGKGSFLNPKLNKRKVGEKTVYDVSGKVHIDYTAPEPNISFKVTPALSSLSECKREKVEAFKGPSGALGKHEAEHATKMKTFNGSEEFDHTFTGLEANSTEELTKQVNAALDAVVQPKIKARQAAAQKASDDLDPWSEPIPGISSCP